MTREEESAVIARVLAGDSNAFEPLVLAHQKNVYNLALKMLGNEDDAFDVSQDAFLRAYNSLASFRGDSRFSVWLYRLTSNLCLDRLRARKRRNTTSLTVGDEEDEGAELEIPDERPQPEEEVLRKEMREAVRLGMEKLPDSDRQILTLRAVGGLSYEEIASALDLELGTVKSRLSRARKKLCIFLEDYGNNSGLPPSKERKGV